MAPTKTLKKRKTYRKNRHKLKLNHNLCMSNPLLSVYYNEISCNEFKNKCDINQELVILSKQTLTQAQKDVLKKGLSFIPKPKKLNIHQLHNDLRLFMHRMKCKFEFYHKPQQTKNRDPFEIRKPHSFNPERLTDNGTLDTFLHRVRLEIMNEHKHKQNKTDNLTKKERQALNQLVNNPMLVINKADKGSTIVVQDRSEYIAEAMKHLNDQTTYKPQKENITHKLKDLINNKLELLLKNGFLRKPWHQFCKPPVKHRTSKLYFLKKIHKNPMGIRPIVSSCDSITERISQFVDKWLQPYVKNLPSYVKDTTEFINHIEATKLPTNCKLASIDVSSLYTNIPHEEGVQSALHFLKSNPDTYKHPEQPNPEILGELMSLVLKHNVFEKFYLQIQGTCSHGD